MSDVFGGVPIKTSWGARIALDFNGDYRRRGGSLVTSAAELEAIEPGPDRDRAMEWLLTRQRQLSPWAPPGAIVNGHAIRLLYFYPPDHTWRYCDTKHIVDDRADLHRGLDGSGALDAALHWWEQMHPRPAASPPSPMAGLGPEEKVLEAVASRQPRDSSLEDIAEAMEVQPSAQLKALINTMVLQGRLACGGGRYVLAPRAWRPPDLLTDRPLDQRISYAVGRAGTPGATLAELAETLTLQPELLREVAEWMVSEGRLKCAGERYILPQKEGGTYGEGENIREDL